MEHSDDSHEIVRPGEGRDQWLAMQAAYAEYRRASEALVSDQMADDSLARRGLEAQQRVAFEQYMDARLAFLEFRFDESSRPRHTPVDPTTRERAYPTFASRFATHRPLFLALAIGLLCTAALSVVRAQQRVRALEAARDQLRAELSAARDDIQRVSTRVDGWKPVQPPPAPEVKPQPAPTPRTAGAVRRSYRFSLAPSRKFKRVGPIEVSIRSVDARQNRISLSILSDSARLNFQHVRLNQPVRIAGSDHGQRMELVIDRIAAGGVYGHLIEYRG